MRTIRFWADRGVVADVQRSAGGYRLFDAAAVARFELVRTLRELGIGLENIQEILSRRVTAAEVAATHAHRMGRLGLDEGRRWGAPRLRMVIDPARVDLVPR